MWNQNHSRLQQRRQKFDRGGTSTRKCVFYKINEKQACLCSLDTSIIALAQRVESTGTGGDRSINSFYSCQLLTISSLVKNEKKNKEKK